MAESKLSQIRNKRNERGNTLSSSNNAGTLDRIRYNREFSGFKNLDSDLQSTNKMLSDVYGGWQTQGDMASYKTQLESANKQLSAYNSLYGSYLDDAQKKTISDTLNDYNDILKGWDNISSMYGMYKNADAYGIAKRKEDIKDKYKGYSFEDIQKAIDETEDIQERNYLRSYTDYSTEEDYNKAINAIEERKGMTSAHKENLEAAKSNFLAQQEYADDKARNDELSKKYANFTSQNGLVSLLATPVNAISSVLTPLGIAEEKLVSTITGQNYNPYKSASGLQRITNASTAQITENVREDLGTLGAIGYGALSSGIPSRIGQRLFGGAYNVIMGIGSFATTYADAIESGMSVERASEKAFVAGLIEYATEQIGMDWAFGEGKDAIGTVLRQFMAEGSEELVGNLANAVYDTARNGRNSDLSKEFQNYVSLGYSDDEARKMVASNFAKETAEAFMAAGLSAGAEGGVHAARVSNIGASVDNDMLSQYAEKNGIEKYKELLGNNEELSNYQKGVVYLESRNENKTAMKEAKDEVSWEKALLNKETLNAMVKADTKAEKTSIVKDETLLNKLNEYEGENKESYTRNYELAYQMSEKGFKLNDIIEAVNSDVISNEEVTSIYETVAGNNIDNGIAVRRNTEEINTKWNGRYKSGSFDVSEVDVNSLSKTEKSLVGFLQMFSKMGMNIKVINDASAESKNGITDGRTITINLKARYFADSMADEGKYAVATFAHESTHWMRNILGEEFSTLTDVVKQSIGMRKWNNFVATELSNTTKENMSIEEAEEEVIARICEDMLNNTDNVDRLLATANENQVKRLVKAIKKWFAEIKADIRQLLTGYASDSVEAKYLRQFENEFKAVEETWLNMFEKALALNQVTTEEFEAMDPMNVATDNVVMASEKTYEKGGKEFITKFIYNQIANDMLSEEAGTDILDKLEDIYKLSKEFSDNPEYADYSEWQKTEAMKDSFGNWVTAIVSNGDYDYNIDFSTVCKKRKALDRVLNGLVKQGIFDNYVPSEKCLTDIINTIKKHDLEVACALCFVDAKRYRIGSWAKNYLEGFKVGKKYNIGYNEMVREMAKLEGVKFKNFDFLKRDVANLRDKGVTIDQVDLTEDSKAYKYLKDIMDAETNKSTNNYIKAETLLNNKDMRKQVREYEIMSSAGFEAIRSQNRKLFDLVKASSGSATPKLSLSEVAFTDEVAKDFAKLNTEKQKKMRDDLRKVGGYRLQSFSDYMGNMVFDYVQCMSNLSACGFKAHSYTKEYAYVKLFGMTGMKINMSVVPDSVSDELKQKFYKITQNEKKLKNKEFDDIRDEYLFYKDHAGFAECKASEADYTDYEKNYKTISKEEYDKLSDKAKSAYTERNWKYITVDESFPLDKAYEIQKDPRYNKNCGIIWVGVSNAHIRSMLRNENIPMVIPYHKSNINAFVAHLRGIAMYNDYTSSQNERMYTGSRYVNISKTSKNATNKEMYRALHEDFNFYDALEEAKKEWKPGSKRSIPQMAADKYLAFCKELGDKYGVKVLPKFSQFANEDNYYKLLEDFRLYDGEGNYAEQKDVTMTFPEDFGYQVKVSLDETALTSKKMAEKENIVLDETKSIIEADKNEKRKAEKKSEKNSDKVYGEARYAGDSSYSKQGNGYDEVRRAKENEIIKERNIKDNSSEEAYSLYNELKGIGSRSMSGNIYRPGRKPSGYDVAMGLENFFNVGEERLSPNKNGGYDIETWTGNDWAKTKNNQKYSDKVLMGSVFSGGGTLEAGLVYQMVDKEFAVEHNKQIATVYTDNHGKEHMFVGDVRDFNSKEKRNVFYLHASPVCKNFSAANTKGGETTLDITTAEATARILEEQMPQVFTLENVKRYKGSEAYNLIINKLNELGYTWDVDVYNSADYGAATSRERLIVRAVKDGNLPNKPVKVGAKSWYEVTSDLIDTLPESPMPNWIKERFDRANYTIDKPLLILGGDKSYKLTTAYADEPSPTLLAKSTEARIVMPDGRVLRATPRVFARIQGLSDDYKLPDKITTAYKVVGNGIPTQLTKAVMGGVLDSAYEQTHEGRKLYSSKVDSQGNKLTENQVKYFEKSQIRDKNGNLLVVYHGTPSKSFNYFSYSQVGMVGGSNAGYGFYFSPSKKEANLYAQGIGHVKEGYLNITNAIIGTDNDLALDAMKLLNNLPYSSKADIISEFGSLEKAAEGLESYNNATFLSILPRHIDVHPQTVNSTLWKMGYDGIIYDDGEYEAEYIAFESSQFKNIDNKNPTQVDDIRYSEKVSNKELLDMDSALFIKNTKKANYIDMIFNGEKTEETRSTDSLKEFVGKEMPVTDGKYVYGYIVLGKAREISAEDFHKDENQIKHRVPELDKYDVKAGGKKYSYPILSYRRIEKQKLSDSKDYKYSFQAREMKFSDKVSDNNEASYNGERFWSGSVSLADGFIEEVHPYEEAEYWGFHHSLYFTPEQVDKIDSGENAFFWIQDGYIETDWRNGEAPKEIVEKIKKQIVIDEKPKFSDKVKSEDYFGQNKRLEKENAQLKEDIARLARRLKLEKVVTNGTVLDEKKLQLAAHAILKDARSSYDEKKLAEELKELYGYIIENSNKEILWDEVMNKASVIAKKVLDSSKTDKITDDYYKGIVSDIRKARIKLSEEQIQEVKSWYGDDWRRDFFGKIVLTKDGRSLDSYWSEWASMYPEVFDEDTNPNDQVTKLLDIYDEMKDLSAEYVRYNDNESIRALAVEIYNKFWNVPTVTTVADKYTKEIKKLKFEHRQTIEKLKADQKLADAIHYGKAIEKLRNKKAAEMERYKKYKKDQADKAKDASERKAIVGKITKVSTRLMDWMTENSAKEHVPEALKPVVSQLLRSINFSSKQLLGMRGGDKAYQPTNKDISLRKALDRIKEMVTNASTEEGMTELGRYIDFPPTYAEDLKNITKTATELAIKSGADNAYILNMMTVDELTEVYNMVKTMEMVVRNLNKKIASASTATIADEAQTDIIANDKLGDKKHKKGLYKFFEYDNALPIYAFEHLGKGAFHMFEGIQDGWDKFAFNIKRVVEFSKETFNGKQRKAWSEHVNEVTVTVVPTEEEQKAGGQIHEEKVFMTDAQIMSIYCLSKREHAKTHFAGGGIRMATIKDGRKEIVQTQNIRLNEEELSKIIGLLSEEQIAVADKLQEFMNTVCKDWGNEVSMKRFGIKGFNEENYFPIKVDSNVLATENRDNEKSIYALLNMGFTKPIVPKASAQMEIGDIFDTFTVHASEMAKYNSIALPVLDMVKWYNYKEKDADGKVTTMKGSIETAHGEAAKSYIMHFLNDLNGNTESGRGDNLMRTFTRNFKVAAVAGNLQVALLQPISILRASAIMEEKYLLSGMANVGKIKYGMEMCQKYSGIAVWKGLSLFDTNVSRGLDAMIKQDNTIVDKAIEISMKGAEKADEITWGAIWNACEAETRDKTKLEGEELYKATAKRFRDVVYHTQVVDSTMTRTDVMRSKALAAQWATSFMSEPSITMNLFQDLVLKYTQDVRQYGYKEAVKRNRMKLLKVGEAYLACSIAEAVLRGIIGKYRKPDDDERMVEMMWDEFKTNLNLLNNIPIARDIVSIFNGYKVERPDVEFAQNAYYAYTGFAKNGITYKNMYRLATTMSQISGLPISSTMREFEAAVKLIMNITE